MAIDTAEKRRAVSGVPFLPLGAGVTPDVDKPQFWRWAAGWNYFPGGNIMGGCVSAIQSYIPGVRAIQNYQPGVQAAEKRCE